MVSSRNRRACWMRLRHTGIDGWDTSKRLWRVLDLVRPSALTWRLDSILGNGRLSGGDFVLNRAALQPLIPSPFCPAMDYSPTRRRRVSTKRLDQTSRQLCVHACGAVTRAPP
ncbi:hypothetical protein FOZ60_005813 [Perkinsus olseni]|uniref:Uncharacterized protein n=1 Tax=Perkinsus olseni TaxID=32597 RepID=A0A7J6PH60_PEROL|nr:hypothetical protein FOZ60_005813 [Perkinsus olseni]